MFVIPFPSLFSRSSDTILGETGDPSELFISDDCDNNPLGAIMGKVNVSESPCHTVYVHVYLCIYCTCMFHMTLNAC